MIKSVAHFSIPVSDIARSTRFYTEVVGCRYLRTTPRGTTVFLDARGVCVILVEQDPPINPVWLDPVACKVHQNWIHHAFAIEHDQYTAALDHLRAHRVAVLLEEDRQGGVLNGRRAYFHDPDGTILEFIDLTTYVTTPAPTGVGRKDKVSQQLDGRRAAAVAK
jgi:catechol 2,3-dioxygenase-like lactoylglutathione lyase family enzyme